MRFMVYKGPSLWYTCELLNSPVVISTSVHEKDNLTVELIDAPSEYDFSMYVGDESVIDPPRAYWDRSHGVRSLQWPERRYFDQNAGRCEVRLSGKPNGSTECEPRDWAIYFHVAPSKLTESEFDQLLDGLTGLGRGLLYDIYGRARLGLQLARRATVVAPEEQLDRLQGFVRRVSPVLRKLRRTPAHRVYTAYEVGSPDNLALDIESLRWLAGRPDEVHVSKVSGRTMVWPQRALRAVSGRDLDIYEHRVIKSVLRRVLKALDCLDKLAHREISILESERAWKDQGAPAGGSWWQSYNVPRILAAKQRIMTIQTLRAETHSELSSRLLKDVRSETTAIRLTPLFHQHPDYGALYQSILKLARDGMFTPDTHELLLRVRDLPSLYEMWCFLQVATALTSRAAPATNQPLVLLDDDRYTLHIKADTPLMFQGPSGVSLRLYFQRMYHDRGNSPISYGRLTEGRLLLPDIVVEMFDSTHEHFPRAIYVFDPKYKHLHSGGGKPTADWDKMWRYVHEIGSFNDSKPLVRHAWVLSADSDPMAKPHQPTFFSSAFQPQTTVGTIPLRPQFDSTQFLRVFDRLLELDGIAL